MADSFTINDETNDAKELDGAGDRGVITESGTIDLDDREWWTSGDAAPGVTISNVATLEIAGDIRMGKTAGFTKYPAVKVTNANPGKGALVMLKPEGQLKTLDKPGLESERDDFKFIISGGDIETDGSDAHGVYSTGKKLVFEMSNGDIETKGSKAHGVYSKGATAIFTISGGRIKTNSNDAYGVYSTGRNLVFEMSGGDIETDGSKAHGVYSTGDNFEFTISGGKIKTNSNDAHGVYLTGRKLVFEISSGDIETKGSNAHGVYSVGDNFEFTMDGGQIIAEGAGARGFFSMGEDLSFTMRGGSITSSQSDAIGLYLFGNAAAADSDRYEHLIKIGPKARIATTGEASHGILILHDEYLKEYLQLEYESDDDARARLDIAGSITVKGKGAVGVLIKDATGGVSEFEISGTITATGAATTAIENTGNLPLTIAVKNGARITGAVIMGTDADTITLTGDATITGNIHMGRSNDTFTLVNGLVTGDIHMGRGNDTFTLGAGTVQGDILMGPGNDTFTTSAGATGRVAGWVDGGIGIDTLNLAQYVGPAAGYELKYKNFEFDSALPEHYVKVAIPSVAGENGNSIKPGGKKVEKKPPELKPEVKKPSELKPEVKKPPELKPEVKKPSKLKPEVKKPPELKPEVKKPSKLKPEVKKQKVSIKPGIVTEGRGKHGITSEEDKAKIIRSGESKPILTKGTSAWGIYASGADVSIQSGGSITTEGDAAFGIASFNDEGYLEQTGGKITTAGFLSHGIYAAGSDMTIIQSGGSITTTGISAHGIYLRADCEYFFLLGCDVRTNHLIETRVGAAITTSGAGAHGILIGDLLETDFSLDKPTETKLNLGGSIKVTGRNAVGVLIRNDDDNKGLRKITEFKVSGQIEATGEATMAIWNQSDQALHLEIEKQARITGNIRMGGGDDTLWLSDNARVIGDIFMGKGDDLFGMKGRAWVSGRVDGGPGADTLDLEDYDASASASYRLRHINFETFKLPAWAINIDDPHSNNGKQVRPENEHSIIDPPPKKKSQVKKKQDDGSFIVDNRQAGPKVLDTYAAKNEDIAWGGDNSGSAEGILARWLGFNYCGPGTKLDYNTLHSDDPSKRDPTDRVDAACLRHDIKYDENYDTAIHDNPKDLRWRHQADVVLMKAVLDIPRAEWSLFTGTTLDAFADRIEKDLIRIKDVSGKTGRVTETGVITAPADGIGIDHISGDNVEIIVEGQVLGTDGDTDFVSIPIRSAVGRAAKIEIKDIKKGTSTIVEIPGLDKIGGDGVRIKILGAKALVHSRDLDRGADAIQSGGNKATIEQSGGLIMTEGENAHGINSSGDTAMIKQSGGEIRTRGRVSHGIHSAGNKATIKQSGGLIVTGGENGYGIYLAAAGNREEGEKDAEHSVTTSGDAAITTSGAQAHGILIDDDDLIKNKNRKSSSRTALILGGSVKVTGQDAVAVKIADTTGGVTRFEVTGKIEASGKATTAIENSGNLPLVLDIKERALITGNINMGTGADTFNLDGGIVTGDIDMGDGNDTFTLGAGTVQGDVLMGKGDDTFTTRAAATGQVTGWIDGGIGTDTLDLAQYMGPAAGYELKYRNFEVESALPEHYVEVDIPAGKKIMSPLVTIRGVAVAPEKLGPPGDKPGKGAGLGRSVDEAAEAKAAREATEAKAAKEAAEAKAAREAAEAKAAKEVAEAKAAREAAEAKAAREAAEAKAAKEVAETKAAREAAEAKAAREAAEAKAAKEAAEAKAAKEVAEAKAAREAAEAKAAREAAEAKAAKEVAEAKAAREAAEAKAAKEVAETKAAREAAEAKAAREAAEAKAAREAAEAKAAKEVAEGEGGEAAAGEEARPPGDRPGKDAGLGRSANLGRSAGNGAQRQGDNQEGLEQEQVPVVASGSKSGIVVYIDPTGYALQASAVGVLSNAVHTVVSQRLSPSNQRRAAIRRQIQLAAAGELFPGLLFRDPRPLIWTEFFGGGRSRGQEKVNHAYDQNYKGVVLGMEQSEAGDAAPRLGLLLGYADSSVKTRPASSKTTTESLFGGIYGQLSWHGLAIGGGLNVGHEWHKGSRYYMRDGLADTARADYNSWFLSPSLEVSGIYPLSGRFELRPSASVNYTAGFYDGYKETGLGERDLTLDSRMLWSTISRLSVAAAFMPDEDQELSLRAGVSNRFTGGDKIKGRVSGSAFSFSSTGDRSVYSGFVALDLRYQFDGRFSVVVNTEYSHSIGGSASERELGGSLMLQYEF